MAGLDQNEIQMLIECEKMVTEAPKKNMQLKNRSFRNDMQVFSTDQKYKFSVFMRISEDFPEDFSVGLIYCAENGKNYMIFRCNGPHGETLSDFLSDSPHYGYHEHIILPETNAMASTITAEYGTYQDAVAHFCKKCNIIDAKDYFAFLSDDNQLQLELGN